jgi:hypothetical protein
MKLPPPFGEEVHHGEGRGLVGFVPKVMVPRQWIVTAVPLWPIRRNSMVAPPWSVRGST